MILPRKALFKEEQALQKTLLLVAVEDFFEKKAECRQREF